MLWASGVDASSHTSSQSSDIWQEQPREQNKRPRFSYVQTLGRQENSYDQHSMKLTECELKLGERDHQLLEREQLVQQIDHQLDEKDLQLSQLWNQLGKKTRSTGDSAFKGNEPQRQEKDLIRFPFHYDGTSPSPHKTSLSPAIHVPHRKTAAIVTVTNQADLQRNFDSNVKVKLANDIQLTVENADTSKGNSGLYISDIQNLELDGMGFGVNGGGILRCFLIISTIVSFQNLTIASGGFYEVRVHSSDMFGS